MNVKISCCTVHVFSITDIYCLSYFIENREIFCQFFFICNTIYMYFHAFFFLNMFGHNHCNNNFIIHSNIKLIFNFIKKFKSMVLTNRNRSFQRISSLVVLILFTYKLHDCILTIDEEIIDGPRIICLARVESFV